MRDGSSVVLSCYLLGLFIRLFFLSQIWVRPSIKLPIFGKAAKTCILNLAFKIFNNENCTRGSPDVIVGFLCLSTPVSGAQKYF